MQDLAHHTRVTPEQRKLTMEKFMHNVNSVPEARKELENWGLQLENQIIMVGILFCSLLYKSFVDVIKLS